MTRGHALPDAPPSLSVGGRWQFGIYRTPADRVDLPTGGLRRLRLKEWQYVSFTTDDWYVAVGLVQMGYVGSLFAYVVDRSRGDAAVEYRALSPLGRSVRVAPSSVRGTTSWKSPAASLSIRANEGWDVDVDVPLGNDRLRGHARIEYQDSLVMLHPLGSGRVAYTHKAAGCRASGQLTLGARSIDLGGGLGSSDWTRSQADRVTAWKWASLSGFSSDGAAIGLNLSAEVYDDARGHSVENALFVDGDVRSLSGVRFEVPTNPKTAPWTIRSIDGDEVDLAFQPAGALEERMNFGVVRSDFVQPYGQFSGHVCGHDVTGCFGVVEKHLSVW
ncbi:MAG: hypothetical protein DRJ42_30465 [Deltaproteobacteria bacterium]|nr:MAG: hypothetical protein DRJ42_30465 [Deltaproteobacteria bacterium]